jgi:hypothetical protein
VVEPAELNATVQALAADTLAAAPDHAAAIKRLIARRG